MENNVDFITDINNHIQLFRDNDTKRYLFSMSATMIPLDQIMHCQGQMIKFLYANIGKLPDDYKGMIRNMYKVIKGVE